MKIKSVFGNLLANKKKVAKKKSDTQKYFKLGQNKFFRNYEKESWDSREVYGKVIVHDKKGLHGFIKDISIK